MKLVLLAVVVVLVGFRGRSYLMVLRSEELGSESLVMLVDFDSKYRMLFSLLLLLFLGLVSPIGLVLSLELGAVAAAVASVVCICLLTCVGRVRAHCGRYIDKRHNVEDPWIVLDRLLGSSRHCGVS
jgi:hypothetical protein